jgi:hypothetical protein
MNRIFNRWLLPSRIYAALCLQAFSLQTPNFRGARKIIWRSLPWTQLSFFRSFERYMDGFRKQQYCPLLLSENNLSLGTQNLVNADAFWRLVSFPSSGYRTRYPLVAVTTSGAAGRSTAGPGKPALPGPIAASPS